MNLSVLLLALVVGWAPLVVADAKLQQVATQDELKQAIVAGASYIVFVANITLDEATFPEPRATCLRSETTIEALMECDRNAVIYTTQPGANSTRATWTALDGIVLDARFLFRGIILARDLDINGVAIAQMLDDRNPFYFLFGFIGTARLRLQGCTFFSPCGGRGPRDVVNAILEASPDELQFEPSGTFESKVLEVDTLQGVPIEGFPNALIGAFQAKIQCYNPATAPFAPMDPPTLWRPEAKEADVIEGDSCQRPETLGGDYRGTVSTTASGRPCLMWSHPTRLNHTMTPELLPTFGLGTANKPHNHCRNPDRDRGVWCYVAGEAGGRELCDVDACDTEVQLRLPSADSGAAAAGESSGAAAVPGGSSGLSEAGKWGIIAAAIAIALLQVVGVWVL